MSPAPQRPSWPRLLVRAARSSAERQDLVWELRRRWQDEPPLPPGTIRNVMVVCHGNICRSPFAERHLAAGLPQLTIRSAGLHAAEGDPAQPGALSIGPEFGTDLSQHASHRLENEDIDWADLILGMTGRHRASIEDRWTNASEKTRLLGDFLPGPPYAIEDPWGRDLAFFRSVFEQISVANNRIIQLLEST